MGVLVIDMVAEGLDLAHFGLFWGFWSYIRQFQGIWAWIWVLFRPILGVLAMYLAAEGLDLAIFLPILGFRDWI